MGVILNIRDRKPNFMHYYFDLDQRVFEETIQ